MSWSVVAVFLHIHTGHRAFHFLIFSFDDFTMEWSGGRVRACMCVACGDLPFFLFSSTAFSNLMSMSMKLHQINMFLTFRSYTTDAHCQTPTMHSCFCETTCCILPNSAHHPIVYSLPSPLLC
ncbi:hypothetical protein BO78DRAFT_195752 [Aspergillus sclerotiicarbonarius CBS 121057]|uniref:Uncharacterized protein n=1 Tax=Aspergillus sclerotiicarbonarius (strain CBS 121057 / IBT 28362) TaxID=1448318 RepID=A0A319E0A1_ASPSB|nr:hypothetical protein BO78DRAFT_195752 [Aspergillus sclerotiicarbonarius CBS 121057]